jgi:hypothetical protein
MAQPLQTTDGAPRQDARRLPTVVVLTALGVVYGDIGTSTLYGLKQAVEAGGGPAPETVMGIVSLIFWALLLIVGLKYAILILRADNHGEGGIVALLALLDARHAPRGSPRASLLIVGLIGAALLYGDGVITPAISVLSAVEGLKIDAPALAPMVIPITIGILIGLFLVQRKGTEFVGNIFGPVMLAKDIVAIRYSKDAGPGRWENDTDVTAFEALRAKYLPNVDRDNTIAYAGYGQAASMTEILRRCGDELTRANVLKQASMLAGFHSPFFLDDINYSYTPDDYTPMKTLHISIFDGKGWQISEEPVTE